MQTALSIAGAVLLSITVAFWSMVMLWRGDVPLLGPSVIHTQPDVAQTGEETSEVAENEIEEGAASLEEPAEDISEFDIEGADEDVETEQPTDTEVVIPEEPSVSEASYAPPLWKFKVLSGKVSKTEVSLHAQGAEVAVGTYDGWCEEISAEELRMLGDAQTAAYCQSLKERVIFVMSVVDGTLSLHMLRSNTEEPELIHEW
jgi:hypothetical protein